MISKQQRDTIVGINHSRKTEGSTNLVVRMEEVHHQGGRN